MAPPELASLIVSMFPVQTNDQLTTVHSTGVTTGHPTSPLNFWMACDCASFWTRSLTVQHPFFSAIVHKCTATLECIWELASISIKYQSLIPGECLPVAVSAHRWCCPFHVSCYSSAVLEAGRHNTLWSKSCRGHKIRPGCKNRAFHTYSTSDLLARLWG